MNDFIWLFNCACSDGNISYVKNNIDRLKPEEIEFGLSLAACNNHVDIVSFILEAGVLLSIAKNCLKQEDNAFMSSFTLQKQANNVTEYLLNSRKYKPREDILIWIEENNIKYDIASYYK